MKFVTYSIGGKENVGVLSEDEKSVIPASELGFKSEEMVSLIRELDGSLPEISGKEKAIPLCGVKLEAPIPEPVQDVICLGLNYRDHAEEAAKSDSAYDVQRGEAVYFSKRVNRAVAPFEDIDSNYPLCTELDYEVELAVIIGKDAKNVKAEDAGGVYLRLYDTQRCEREKSADEAQAVVLRKKPRRFYAHRSCDRNCR